MRVVLGWLREMCPVDLDVDELARVLTMQGANVEGVVKPWDGLSGVVTARVLEVRDHPSSNKPLWIAQVDDGAGTHQVVAGVGNFRPGDVVPWARPGARVPVLDVELGRKNMAGETSNGMLCSPRELAISGDHGGILVLPPDTPVGVDVAERFGLDDVVFDIEVKPNRPDLMSVAGVAREVAAATGAPFALPEIVLDESLEEATAAATVEIRDGERCPRYLAKVVRGVTIGPSPITVQARLTAAGMRPLSNVVDATNYVMLELGQPLHGFDLARLAGPGIVVRMAGEGERLTTLDDVERDLTPEDLVIGDLEHGVAIAGVMGSADAEVSADTSDVLIESATFQRRTVLRTARRLNLRTEASMRFERGVDPEGPGRAADRAAQLITAWSGGRVLAGTIMAGHDHVRPHVAVRPSRASLLLGEGLSARDVREAFGRLRIEADETGDDEVVVEVPGYRVDLEIEPDLIEDVARIRGYDNIASTVPPVRQSGGLQPSYAFRMRVREALVRAGLRETLSLSFASADDLALTDDHDAVRVANPLAADDAFLRTSLLPRLLGALRYNLDRSVRSVALFEVGRTFYPGTATDDPKAIPVEEHDRIGIAMTGLAANGWPDPAREYDVFDLKGVVESLMDSLGIAGWEVGPPPGPLFHPTRSASIAVGEELAGEFGELHPDVAARLDLPGRVGIAELEMGVLAQHASTGVVYAEVPRFPPVRRDLAFVLPADVPESAVHAAIVGAVADLGVEAVLFDVHTGPPIPEGRKSLAFAVDLRAPDRTLTDEDAARAVAAIQAEVGELGGELRAG
ncbi:MAG TPA: phenylalanine--tRNA ligase subunit beta [Actinomycetota bacterium]|nr:phenylalanine--tRNA ligase subunit beta [Actinomycetota bacterium]